MAAITRYSNIKLSMSSSGFGSWATSSEDEDTIITEKKKLNLDTIKGSEKYATMFKIFQISYNSLNSGVVSTKRDIYYKDVNLFKSTRVVDKSLALIKKHHNIFYEKLNIIASPKGLYSGSISIFTKDRPFGNFSTKCDWNLVPYSNSIIDIQCESDFVLIVEKEAIYEYLISSGFFGMFPKSTLITGKGYPVDKNE
ncbi:DNA topoisomerase IV, alpha subunit [Neoconidiobolus thromboides FSU 785]|nr:DNA topoisomerase IV, alpha subunit [Neoconidiobolus thromboides FSU 785]